MISGSMSTLYVSGDDHVNAVNTMGLEPDDTSIETTISPPLRSEAVLEDPIEKFRCKFLSFADPTEANCTGVLDGSTILFNGREMKKIGDIGVGYFCSVILVTDVVTLDCFALKIGNGKRYTMDLDKEFTLHQAASRSSRFVLKPLEFDSSATFYGVVDSVEPVNYPAILMPKIDLLVPMIMKKYKVMSEQEAKFYVAQIIVAIERMDEDCKIFHHDPHLYNLMMTPKGDILMIDFGLARSPFWSQGEYRVRSLTEEDMVAIEESRLISWIYVSRAAIHMLTGFQEDTVEVWPANIFDSWKGDKPYIMDPKQIENLGSDDLKDFIMTCRTPRVFLFKEFGSIRNHRWLKDVAWEEIESGECLSPFFP